MKRYYILTATGTVVSCGSLLLQLPDYGGEWRVVIQMLGIAAAALFGWAGTRIDVANERSREGHS